MLINNGLIQKIGHPIEVVDEFYNVIHQ
jgi:hypothetical protein